MSRWAELIKSENVLVRFDKLLDCDHFSLSMMPLEQNKSRFFTKYLLLWEQRNYSKYHPQLGKKDSDR